MWAGLWQKRCKFPETATAIAYEQHGFFEQVRESMTFIKFMHCCQLIGLTVLQITPSFIKVLFNLMVITEALNCIRFTFNNYFISLKKPVLKL